MATTHKFRKIVYSSLFGLGLTAGGVTLASAATNQQQPPSTVEAPAASADKGAADSTESEKNEVDKKPNYTSSVTVDITPEGPESAEGSEADEDQADKAEQAKLAKVAKIDANAASKVATDKVPGTVGDVELEEEAGNVVYQVGLTAKDGTETEVIVDAGNAKILAQQSEAAEGNEANDAPEGPEAPENGKDATTVAPTAGADATATTQ